MTVLALGEQHFSLCYVRETITPECMPLLRAT